MTDKFPSSEEDSQSPAQKNLGNLPPRIAAKLRRERARRKLQKKPIQEAPSQPEEERLSEEGEPGAAIEPEPKPMVPRLEPSPPESPLRRRELPKRPDVAFEVELRPRKVPTFTGLLKDLAKGAWEALSSYVSSSYRRLKRRRGLEEDFPPIISEHDLLDRRQKVRGYVLISTVIHLLIFLPIINIAMLRQPDRKPPIYIKIVDIPPAAKKIAKTRKRVKTPKTTTKRVRKVVEARGPRPAPRPIRRPMPTKRYVSPSKMLKAKAVRVAAAVAPEAPKLPRVKPARLEARRPRSVAEPPREMVRLELPKPTRPLVLPEVAPKVKSLAEAQPVRVASARRPTVLAVKPPLVPDREGKPGPLVDANLELLPAQEEIGRPTAPPPLPSPGQKPAPRVLGQVAAVEPASAPVEAAPVVPRVAASPARPSGAHRPATESETSLLEEEAPEAPARVVSFGDTKELGPIGSAPAEFQEEITIPLNSEDPRFKEYLEAVKRRILEVWRYPDDAEPGLRGKVSLEFSIERDGSVSRVTIITASGYSALDRGAVEAMHRASPFPPLPKEFRTNRLNIIGGFRYN